MGSQKTKRILKEMVEESTLKIEGERKARKYLLSGESIDLLAEDY